MQTENDFALMAIVTAEVKVIPFDDGAKLFARLQAENGSKSLRVVVEHKGAHDQIKALASRLSVGTLVQAKGELWYKPANPDTNRKAFLKLEARSLQVIAPPISADKDSTAPATSSTPSKMPSNFFGDSMPS